MKSLIEKLVTVQSELKAPKTQENTFGKYRYRKAEDILEAAKPLLKEQGLYLSLTDKIVNIGDRFYVKSTASITDGEFKHKVSAIAREESEKKGMDGSQITGAASSYARKYALNGLFGIDDTADSDATNDHCKQDTKAQNTQKQPATSTQQQVQNFEKSGSKRPDGPVRLSPKDEKNPERWLKVIKWLNDNNKTEEDWPEIKKKMYIITENDEKQLFEEMEWLPF